jgi:16S rRNA processing protein RimM
MSALVCVARIGAPHGVRGEVRLWSFTDDPLAVAEYGPLTTRDGSRRFTIAAMRAAKDHLVVRFEGVPDREAAQALTGVELYVSREVLPETEDGEYYLADLIGLTAIGEDGGPIGRVLAVHNFGAGDIIEVAPASGPTLLLPFTDAVVPTVDLAAGHVVVVPPQEIDGED